MNRPLRIATIVVLGSIAALSSPVHGQDPRAGAVGDLGSLARQMADRVRELGAAIESDLKETPSGANLLRDSRELALALDEFHKALPDPTNPIRRRQRFGGIDASWHHMLGQMSRAGASSPGVDAAARRVAAIDAQLHASLGANQSPAIYYGSKVSPGGMTEIAHLSHAMVDRAEALLATVRRDMQGPIGTRLDEEVTRLAQAADAFHDGINLDARPDDLAKKGFAEVASASDLLAADLAGIGGQVKIPDRVRDAWQSYQAAETLIRQALKITAPRSEPGTSNLPLSISISNEYRSNVGSRADQLVTQVDDFLIVFTPEAKNVTEGGEFIADARRLRAASSAFRAEIPLAINIGQLAFAYRDVDALWQRLARRTNRIAEVRDGSHIQRLVTIRQTVSEIHRILGMPGFPAEVGAFDGPG